VNALIFTRVLERSYSDVAAPQVDDNPEMHEELLAAVESRDINAIEEPVKEVNVVAFPALVKLTADMNHIDDEHSDPGQQLQNLQTLISTMIHLRPEESCGAS
jgi:hypothetical protein